MIPKKLVKLLKKMNFGKLFYNNKFVLAFSIFISFIIWILTAVNDTKTRSLTISDLPVEVQLSQSAINDGLRIFNEQNLKARVDITGNRFVLGQISKKDIQIVAAQAITTITAVGNYPLELTAKKVGRLTDYEFTSPVNPNIITVMVDRYREIELELKSDVNFIAKSGLFVGGTILSESNVKISGAESEVSRVKKAVVKGDFSGELSETVSLKFPIILLDTFDKPIYSENIVVSLEQVEVTIPILTTKELIINPNFINQPKDANLFLNTLFTVTPSTLEIAGPKDAVESLQKIDLPPIDFCKVSFKNNKFELPIDLPTGCKSLNNNYKAVVTINSEKFKEKKIKITNFTFINLPEGKTPSVYNGALEVTVLGFSGKMNNLKDSDITAQIDLQNNENIGACEVPVKFTVNNSAIWIFGEYFVNVKIN